MSQIIDGVLKDWGERLFYEPIFGRKGRNVLGGRVPIKTNPRQAQTSATVKARLVRTTGKAPEVMVKITGGGKNIRRIKAHLDYISRNGKVELEDENGLILKGADDMRDVRDAWADGRFGIPRDSEKRREAFNVMLSMPPGTNRLAVKEAARKFAAEQFKDHQYVFAAHEDEKHPHVHVCVKAVDRFGVRMNPRKADLQGWRERFAECLRKEGIAANATPRRTRGVVRKAEKQAVRWIDRDYQQGRRSSPSKVRTGRNAAVARELAGLGEHDNPAVQAIGNARQDILRAYGELAKTLAKSSDSEDRKLALNIVEFVKTMPTMKTRHQMEMELARAGQGGPARVVERGPVER
ncbi:MAG: relaxase/mobilization nuclease domain-containing protein [Candidatus Accumulibacter sp.]|jgi:hypothetical protein|nr:relaxase/mobilization nuclease domain-containing protein [Accumulibacter sp.]